MAELHRPTLLLADTSALTGLEDDMVMEDFQDLLEAHSGIAAEDQEVFVGEPPEPLKASIALRGCCNCCSC